MVTKDFDYNNPKIHIESDDEYVKRVALIEGELETELNFCKIYKQSVGEYNATHNNLEMDIKHVSPKKIKEKYVNEVDENLVIEFAENLIKEMKNYDETIINIMMSNTQAIYAASVASKKLAQVTGSKFYYNVITYLSKKQI
jgi:hypothetical protein